MCRSWQISGKWKGSMADSLGLIKVTVVQGKRLVIRDFKSSDPYVVVKLGNQVTNLLSFFFLNCFYEDRSYALILCNPARAETQILVHRHTGFSGTSL